MLGAVTDPPPGSLRTRIYAMSNGAALHEDDRMVPILACHGRGQPNDIARLCPPGDEFKTRRRNMMTLVDDQMAIVRHQVGYFALTHEALDQRDIYNAGRLPPSASDDADFLRIDIEKCPQPLHPLGGQLATMDENERIAPTLCNEGGSHNRLAEGRRRREHAMVMRQEGVECLYLWGVQHPLESHPARKRIADHPQIVHRNVGALASDQLNGFIEATSWQSHMTRMKFGARDDPGLAEGREPHGLRAIELGILEGCQTYEPCCHRRRQLGPVNIELIGKHDFDLVRQRNADRTSLWPPRRRHAPRLVSILVFHRHPDTQNTAAHLCIGNKFRCSIGG